MTKRSQFLIFLLKGSTEISEGFGGLVMCGAVL